MRRVLSDRNANALSATHQKQTNAQRKRKTIGLEANYKIDKSYDVAWVNTNYTHSPKQTCKHRRRLARERGRLMYVCRQIYRTHARNKHRLKPNVRHMLG